MKSPTLLLICIALFLSQILSGQNSVASYAELPDPAPKDAAAWKTVKSPVSVSFASSDIRYAKHQPPVEGLERQWTATAWKGEQINTQVLVWATKRVASVSAACGNLIGPKGQRIDKQYIKTGFVRYVMTDNYAQGCGAHPVGHVAPVLAADVIDAVATSMPLEANAVQPVWVSIAVPATVAAGTYTGYITIQADKKYKLRVSVEVLRHSLPPAAEWAFDLDFWQHPAAIARVHGVPLWSDAHFALMRPYYEMLARAGQKNITTSIIHEPWNHQTYDDFPSLIRWTKKRDGSWEYDYRLFDRYVSFVMDCGIRQRINCYTLIPWKLSFQYYDEAMGRDTAVNAAPGSDAYTAHWTTMLRDFTRHLKEKGWFEKTSISMDERPAESMRAVITLLKSVDPAWKIALAGGYHPEIEGDLFDYSIASEFKFDEKMLENRKKKGKTSMFYTCCAEAYPNGFTFSPPAESAWIGWYAAAQGFTGYLRWAYNSWTQNPLQDSRFTAWPGGDTYQIYPGPRSAVRFEKLIEGIQDFEKIRILRLQYSREQNKDGLARLEAMLKGFEIVHLKTTPAAQMVSNARKQLNQL